jgi:hypothetical protein
VLSQFLDPPGDGQRGDLAEGSGAAATGRSGWATSAGPASRPPPCAVARRRRIDGFGPPAAQIGLVVRVPRLIAPSVLRLRAISRYTVW